MSPEGPTEGNSPMATNKTAGVRFSGVGYVTKSERIYEAIRDAILDGTLEPGSRINLSRTAQELGASETPVREALKRLESERLVRVEPHAGFVVTDVSIADLIENLVLRREIEPLATCLAAEAMSDEDIKELRALVKEMGDQAQSEDWVSYAATNKRFHHALIARCPLPVVRRTALELWEVGGRSRALFVRNPSRHSNREHSEMVDAIEARDMERLADLVRRQKTTTIHVALELLDEDVTPESAEGTWGIPARSLALVTEMGPST